MGSSYPPPNSDTWRTGFCDCFSDMESCIIGWFCPCILVGRIVEIVDQGATSCFSGCMLYWVLQASTGCGFCYTCTYRARLRMKFGLPPMPCNDCCADHWCPFCSYTQQYRELQRRGINPALGYAANRHIYEAPPQMAPQQVLPQAPPQLFPHPQGPPGGPYVNPHMGQPPPPPGGPYAPQGQYMHKG